MDQLELPVFQFNAGRLPAPLEFSIEELTRDGQYTPIRHRSGNWISISGTRFETHFDMVDQGAENIIGVFHEDDLALDIVFENILRIHAAYSAAASGGVVLHSAGVVVGGEA